jgi:hypothetical protein
MSGNHSFVLTTNMRFNRRSAACLILGKKNSAPRDLIVVLSARRMRLANHQHDMGQYRGCWIVLIGSRG